MKRTIVCAVFLTLAFGTAHSQSNAPTTTITDNSTGKPIEKIKNTATAPNTKPAAAPGAYRFPDAETRQKRYIKSMFGPFNIARQVARAGISTWTNSPEEWGDHWDGFGRRVASNFGKNVIRQTTIYGLDSAMDLDSYYYRSEKRDFGSKFKNALISPVTARNASGKRVIGVPRIAGTYAAHIIAAETWYPDRYSWKDGLKSGSTALGFNVAWNLFKEFVWKK